MAEQASVRVSELPELQRSLGNQLAKIGRSQTSLARKMGLDASAVSRLVKGQRQLKASEAETIEKYLAETAPLADNPLSLKLQQRMDALGLNPRSAALKAGLGQDAIRMVLNGRSRSPRGDTLRALADALECSVDWLTDETDGSSPACPLAKPAPATDAITITQSDTGMWFATRENDRPLFVAAKTLDELCAILPEAVRRAG